MAEKAQIDKVQVRFGEKFEFNSNADLVLNAEYTDLVPHHHANGDITYHEGATLIVLRRGV